MGRARRGRRLRLLLDTHALLWWLAGDERLPVKLRRLIGEEAETVFVSAVSAYEITQKHRLGKLPGAELAASDFVGLVSSQGFLEMPLRWTEAQMAGRIEADHKDPFDRMLIAQALLNDLVLVSNERVFDNFGVGRIW